MLLTIDKEYSVKLKISLFVVLFVSSIAFGGSRNTTCQIADTNETGQRILELLTDAVTVSVNNDITARLIKTGSFAESDETSYLQIVDQSEQAMEDSGTTASVGVYDIKKTVGEPNLVIDKFEKVNSSLVRLTAHTMVFGDGKSRNLKIVVNVKTLAVTITDL